VVQDPPGPTSVNEEWNYDQECAHIKTLIFNQNLYTNLFLYLTISLDIYMI
jgi:hypothetical protein